MGWSRALKKDFILFCKLVQPSPSSSQLPSSRHHHRSCRPCHRPHPRPPPSLPSPLPYLSPLPLLARQPCHCLHRLAALTIFVDCHPHRCHSRCRRHRPIVARPAPSSPLPSLLPPSPSPSSSLATLVAVAITLFVTSAFTRPPPSSPSRRHGWGRGEPYRSGARSYFGRHHRRRHHRCRLCRPRDLPGGAGPTTCRILTPGRQLARRGGAAVGVRVAGVILLADQRRWRWQRRADGGGGGGVGNAATK